MDPVFMRDLENISGSRTMATPFRVLQNHSQHWSCISVLRCSNRNFPCPPAIAMPRRRTPAVTEASPPEDTARRILKRKNAVDAIKQQPEYAECDPLVRPRTPDPEDLTLSKRDWEKMVQRWRADLRLGSGWLSA